MKTYAAYLVAFLAAALTGCSRGEAVQDEQSVNVLFTSGTKSATVVPVGFDETSVNTLDVFLFRKNGMLEAHGRQNDGNSVKVNVTKGLSLDYCLVVNSPADALNGISDREQYEAALSAMADNGKTSFVMTGEDSRTFSDDESLVSTDVSRLMSKVIIRNIVPEFMDTELGKLTVSIDRIYLINNVTECHLTRETTGEGLWINKAGLDEDLTEFQRACMVRSGAPKVVTSTAPVAMDCELYCYPNPVSNGIDSGNTPEWCPRPTRLILEMTIGTQKNYYPITLPSMECNTEYIINNAILLSLGSDHPDIPVTRTQCDFVVEVSPWGTETINKEL